MSISDFSVGTDLIMLNKYGFVPLIISTLKELSSPLLFFTTGPVRHFMELVVAGLSHNPHYSAQEKRAFIEWYKEYFSQFPQTELLTTFPVEAGELPNSNKAPQPEADHVKWLITQYTCMGKCVIFQPLQWKIAMKFVFCYESLALCKSYCFRHSE